MFHFVKEMQKKVREIVMKISNNTAFFSYQVGEIDSLITYCTCKDMGNRVMYTFVGNINYCSLFWNTISQYLLT